MNPLYDAVRTMLYPQNWPRRASLQFAEGVHPYAKDSRLPSHLCQALMYFEQKNRGHRHLLSYMELREERTSPKITGDDRNGEQVRNTFRSSLRRLFSSILALEHEPSDGLFQNLLNSVDHLHYVKAVTSLEILAACGNTGWTKLPDDFRIRFPSFSCDDTVLALTIERESDGVRAKCTIQLATTDRATLRDAKLFFKDSMSLIREALTDVAAWRQFAPRSEVVEVDRSSSYCNATDDSLARIQQATRQFAEVAAPASQRPDAVIQFSAGVQVEPPSELPGQAEMDPVLLARLKQHMHEFVSTYSPAAQALLVENWEQLRPKLPKQ